MAKQTFSVGQVLTASQMNSLQQTAMGGGSATAKTASYTLMATDAGTVVSVNSTSATTITVNTGLFAAGDTVTIQNLNTGVSTITAGTATVNTSASLALAQYEGGQLYFVSASSAIFFKSDGAAPAGGGMTLLDTVTLSGSSTTSAAFSSAYKQIYVYMNEVLGNGSGVRIRLNGDTGSNYAFNYQEIATTWSVDRSTSATTLRVGYSATSSSTLLNNYCEFTITRPSDTDEVLVTGQGYVGLNSGVFYQTAGVYDSSAAITSITFIPDSGTFTGTAFIYGVN